MTDLSRDKYEILDLIFTILNTLCMVLTAILVLSNVMVSIIFTVVIILFAFVILYLWLSRNPFNVYLIRALALNNFIFTFLALMLFYSMISGALSDYPLQYTLLLLPSAIYIIISFKFSAVSTPSDKKEGVMLVNAGRIKAGIYHRFIRDNPEERMKAEEAIAKLKKEYLYNAIIILALVFTISSFISLTFGLY